jgi:hypothetical protein
MTRSDGHPPSTTPIRAVTNPHNLTPRHVTSEMCTAALRGCGAGDAMIRDFHEAEKVLDALVKAMEATPDG